MVDICDLSCIDVLKKLQNAIFDLASGSKTVEVSYDNRTVKYTDASMSALHNLYKRYYSECGAGSGLVDLTSTASSRGSIRVNIYE